MTALMFTTRASMSIRLSAAPMDRFAAATADQGMPPDIWDELDDLAAGQSAKIR